MKIFKQGFVAALLLIVVLLFSGCDLPKPGTQMLQDETGFSQEQVQAIADVLKECGMSSLTAVEHDEALDGMNAEGETGYRLSADGVKNIILYLLDDGTVNLVRYADNTLYESGKVKVKLTDYTLDIDEISDLQYRCQEAVKTVLSSPSTANFPNYTEWGFEKTPQKITVQGYVDAQNGFGAEVRSNFQFVISPDGETIQSFVFDGKELMK